MATPCLGIQSLPAQIARRPEILSRSASGHAPVLHPSPPAGAQVLCVSTIVSFSRFSPFLGLRKASNGQAFLSVCLELYCHLRNLALR